MALIAASAVDFGQLRTAAGGDADLSPNPVAVGMDAPQLDLKPVVVVASVVAEDRWGSA
jgi:hypothetical protein